MDHYGLTEEQMDSVLGWIGEDVYRLLPEPGTKRQQQAAEKKSVVGEAILGSEASDRQVPLGYVAVEKLESILPHPRQHIPWGVRTHFVDPLRRMIFEAKKEAAESG